jgi:hypothetical protein
MSRCRVKTTADRLCEVVGQSSRHYFFVGNENVKCMLCGRLYSKSSSDDSLKYHLHGDHPHFATRMRITPPSKSKPKLTSPSQRQLSRQVITVDVDDDARDECDAASSILSIQPSIFSPSSSSSHSSSSSAASLASTTSTLALDAVGRKRVSAHQSTGSAKRMRQSSIKQYDASLAWKSQAAHKAMVDFFLYEGLSFRLADSPYFRDFLLAFTEGDREVMDRRQLAANLGPRVEDIQSMVTAKLKSCDGVTVGIDGWTNPRHEKVINIVPVGRRVAYYWSSVVLKEYSDAATQTPLIASALKSIIDKGISVVAIVMDNEAVNGAVYRRLKVDFPFLIHLPCAAHTIQLCIKKVMGVPVVLSVCRALERLLHAFKSSKDLRIKMKQQQGLLRSGSTPLQLLTLCDTRWNSQLFAAQRVLLLESCIRPFVPLIIGVLRDDTLTYDDGSFWYPLRALVNFLQPYKAATDVVQSDAATLSDVHEQFAALMVAANDLIFPHPFASIRSDVMAAIRRQWNDHVNLNAIIMCSMLTFSSSYLRFGKEELSRADKWLQEWGTEYLYYYSRSEFKEKEDIGFALQNQLSDFNRGTGAFADFALTREQRAKVAAKQGRVDDPRMVWGLVMGSAPELTQCALALLDLSASEAAVERSFSRQGLIHSKRRSRLSDDKVQFSMSFAFNARALGLKQEEAVKGWEELPDDYMPIDIERGTELLCCSNEQIMAVEEEAPEPQPQPVAESEWMRMGEPLEELPSSLSSEQEEVSELDRERDRLMVEQMLAEEELVQVRIVQEEEERKVRAAAEKKERDREGKMAEHVQRGKAAEEQTAAAEESVREEEQRVAEFVKQYVLDKNIVKGWRVSAAKHQMLAGELITANIRKQVGCVIAMIKAAIAVTPELPSTPLSTSVEH